MNCGRAEGRTEEKRRTAEQRDEDWGLTNQNIKNYKVENNSGPLRGFTVKVRKLHALMLHFNTVLDL